jgi:hypothetical protein
VVRDHLAADVGNVDVGAGQRVHAMRRKPCTEPLSVADDERRRECRNVKQTGAAACPRGSRRL